jgi:transposase
MVLRTFSSQSLLLISVWLLTRGFKLTLHAKIKLDRKNRRVLFHISLEKEVEIYRPENIKTVDVDENSVATLYEAFAIILETDLARTALGYGKKRIQRRDGSGSSEARKAMKRLRERKKKRDCRMKTAPSSERRHEDERSDSY